MCLRAYMESANAPVVNGETNVVFLTKTFRLRGCLMGSSWRGDVWRGACCVPPRNVYLLEAKPFQREERKAAGDV